MVLSELPRLNLPEYNFSIRERVDGAGAGEPEVYDMLRSRWVVLTPEEWVRQNYVRSLVEEHGYSPHRMTNEVSLRLNGTLRRCDTVVYDDHMRAAMIIEYKAPTIAITRNVFDQIARYNMVLGARYLVVTNGMRHYCCEIRDGNYRFLESLPAYAEVRNAR